MTEKSFSKLLELSKKLRKECPWDREQTIKSYYKFILEEAQEFHEAIEKDDLKEAKKELGDLLWNVMFIANIAEDEGLFDLRQILDSAHEKMVRRHPHIFGDAPMDMADIHKKWIEAKKQEKEQVGKKR